MEKNNNLKVNKQDQNKTRNETDWLQNMYDFYDDIREEGLDIDLVIYDEDHDYNEEISLSPLQTALIFIALGLDVNYTENIESDLPTIRVYTDEYLKEIICGRKNPFHIKLMNNN